MDFFIYNIIMCDSELIATEQYITSGTKKLRCGITTGSCAAIASMAATEAILTQKFPDYGKITTPKGWIAKAEILDAKIIGHLTASCAVQKDAGDDPDATDGILVYASVRLEASSEANGSVCVDVQGGEGIGVVTKPGLDQPVGNAAINSVPRIMIAEAVEKSCRSHSFSGKAFVVISAPAGEKIAANTFNPILGIKGGISVLGTSGVVEPMSETALVEAMEVEIKVIAESLREKSIRPVIVTPGNYGSDFIKKYPELADIPEIKCSNFIGAAIDFAVLYGFTHVLFIGHAGKFVKVAGGIMNTHSHVADCRVELIASHAALCGAEQFDIARIFDCATVDAALSILDETGIRDVVIKSLVKAAQRKISQRIHGAFKFGFLMFSNEYGILGKNREFDEIVRQITVADSSL